MKTPTITTDVLTYVQHIGCGIFGQDLFYGRVPNSNSTPIKLWWVTPSSTTIAAHNATGEDTLNCRFELSYRNTSLEDVDRELFRITREIVGSHCYELDNYHTINVELVSAAPRLDIDVEHRVTGTVIFDVVVYNILDPKTPESS